jgi:hypothetical protein
MNSYAAGASASINKTIRELEKVLRDSLPPAGPLRTRLREKVRRLIAHRAERWYRIGFERGHKESRRCWEKTGLVPKKLTADKFAKLPGKKRAGRVHLVSKTA